MSLHGSKLVSSFYSLIRNSFLICLISIIFLLNENSSQLNLVQVIRPVLGSLIFVIIAGGIVYRLSHSITKSAAILFVFCSLFLSYGHLLNFLLVGNFAILAKHRILFPIFLIFFFICLVVILKQDVTIVQKNNGIIYSLLIVFFIYNFSLSILGLFQNQPPKELNKTHFDIPASSTVINEELPDIYWIILDGYERKDALLDHYNLDNSGFIHELENRGFNVPRCSLSNYTLTALSLSTALNMDYIENITNEQLTKKGKFKFKLFEGLIANSEIKRILSEYGYKTVGFETGFQFTELTNSDYYYGMDDKSIMNTFLHPVLNDFEYMFMDTTLIQILFDAPTPVKKAFLRIFSDTSKDKYDLLQNNFDILKQVPFIDGRKYIFAHLLPTHEPFVQNPNNEFEHYLDTQEGYRNSVIATNPIILSIIDNIIENSSVPPIIIVQGDHAYSDRDKTKVLNAYYLPGIKPERISKDITPVNTFRLVLNEFFGFNLPLLANISYLSPDKQNPTNFVLADPSCY